MRIPTLRVARATFLRAPNLRKVHTTHSTRPTATSYPDLKRQNAFKIPTLDDAAFFRSKLGNAGVLSPLGASCTPDELVAYNTDWMGKYRGQSSIVLRPSTTDEVAQVLAYCNAQKLAVSVQGGNTGLVGGAVPVFDEIVLSTSRMNKVDSFDPAAGLLTCGAGCVLEELDNYLAERGHMMPLDLGAKGTCQIGGNVSTNAGGLRLLRYGSLRGSVLGVEAVLADGTVVANLGGLRKDNTGYALEQLFIGAEGTLGVVTRVCILTPVRPVSVHVAVLRVESFETVQSVLAQARRSLGEILSAYEFWDGAALGMTLRNLSNLRHPLPGDGADDPAAFYVLVEVSGSNEEHDMGKLDAFLAGLMETGRIIDGVVAQDETQLKAFWAVREGIPEACSREGAVYKYDISLPPAAFYQLVLDVRAHLREKGLYRGEEDADAAVRSVCGYGHVGDGNIHLNVAARGGYSPAITQALEPFVYEWTQRHRGSVSAEHGLGLMKAHALPFSKSPAAIAQMRSLKALFDPRGILNPYKYLPAPHA